MFFVIHEKLNAGLKHVRRTRPKKLYSENYVWGILSVSQINIYDVKMNRSNTPYSRYNTDNINLFRFSAVKLINLFNNFAYYTHTVRVQLNAKYIHVNRKTHVILSQFYLLVNALYISFENSCFLRDMCACFVDIQEFK